MVKIKAAKIINRFWKEFIVPLYKAKKMVRDEEIDDFEIIEVDRLLNAKKPETQAEFNRNMDKQNLNNNVLKENIELNKQLIEAQKELNRIKAEWQTISKSKKTETIVTKSKLDLLKEQATNLWIDFAPNIWETTLEARIKEATSPKEEIKIKETK